MKTLYIASASAAILLLAASCSETYDILPEEYAKVVRLKQGGFQETTVYSIQDEATYPITIMKGGHNPEMTCNATLRIMSETEFNDYLSESGAGYSYLPANCYSFGSNGSSETLSFDPKEGYKLTGITLYPKEIGKFYETYTDESRDPVIPVILESDDSGIDPGSYQMFVKTAYSIPTIGFKDGGVISMPGAADVISTRVVMPMISQWDINCTVEVDQTLLDEYNDINGTSLTLMPSAAYKFPSTVEIKIGEDYAPFNIELNPDEAGEDTALPIRITRSNAAGLEFKNETILIVNEAVFEYSKYPLTIDENDAYCPDDANGCHTNMYGNPGTDGYHMEGLFNPNADRFFHSCYFEGHHYDETFNSYVEIDLKKKMRNIAFEICPRYKNMGWASGFPQWCKVYAYNENAGEWQMIGEKTGVKTDIDSETMYSLVGPYTAPFPFTKVRFSVVQGYGRVMAGTLPVNGGYWCVGHMAVYGK